MKRLKMKRLKMKRLKMFLFFGAILFSVTGYGWITKGEEPDIARINDNYCIEVHKSDSCDNLWVSILEMEV